MHLGKISFITVLCIPDEFLDRKEILTGYNPFMVLLLPVLVPFMVVLLRLMVKVIGRECLPCQNIAAVPFVRQYLQHGSR